MAKPIDAKTAELMLQHMAKPREVTQAEVMRKLKLKHHSSFYLKFYKTLMLSNYQIK